MQKRYLSNWNYNAARIFDNLEKIVHDNGGVLVSDWAWKREREKFLIVRRGLRAAIQEKREFLEKLEKLNRPAAGTVRAELERLEAIDDAPHETYYGDYRYIQFILNGTYYYYSTDSNPFFPFHYCKAAAPGNVVDRNTYHYEDKKEWLYDCFFSWDCSEADRIEAANMIFNMLMNARMCGKARPARPSEYKPLPGEVL